MLAGSLVSHAKRIKTIIYNEVYKGAETFEIREGILCQHAQRIKYKCNRKKQVLIELSEPIMVAQADKDEPWGYFQFPSIGRADDGTLLVSWQMANDSHMTYGKNTGITMMSKDGGIKWSPQDKDYYKITHDDHICLKDGSLLSISIPPSKDINRYIQFPKPIERKGNYTFYRADELPELLQGIYFTHRKNGCIKTFRAKLNNPGALRYAIDNIMPIVWWGNIRQLADGSLIAGVNPSFYLDSLKHVLPNGVSFYCSKDNGLSWDAYSKIPYIHDGIAERRDGYSFEEPAFEVLEDSTFICVMRSGSASPMYKTFSKDFGQTWSTPSPFTSNGVKPRLMRLNNGVLVLASGRPGIQLRFSFDGTGCTWSDPIDMLPFVKEDGTYNINVSCGYTSILEADDESFYIVYSDFVTKKSNKGVRKTIWCRKITVSNL